MTESILFHEAIARALADNSVQTLFGLIGDANLYFVDSFVRHSGGEFIAAANEAGAALMALGYSEATGRLGFATVTHGPALTNTMTALAHGVKARTPMVLLCGDTALGDRDNAQNLPQHELIQATGAGVEQLCSPDTIARDIATAIRRAWAESRPIALNIPIDMQCLQAKYRPAPYRRPDARALVPESRDLDDAIGIIASARRPIVLAGRGAIADEARASLMALAERLEAPLATTLAAKDLFRGEPFNLGIFGTLSQNRTAEAIAEADCVIAFGASLNQWTLSQGTFARGKRFVQVDIDPGQIGRNLVPDVGVLGEAGRTADLFVHWLDEAEIPGCGWRSESFAAEIAGDDPYAGLAEPAPGDAIEMVHAMRLLDQAFPQERSFVTDAGRFLAEPWKNVHASHPRQFVLTTAIASIGLGMGYAIGAATSDRSRPVLHITGDGGFMLGGLAEFNTAVRYKLDIVTVICNDAAYGAEHIQFRRKEMDPALSTFEWPDFASVADALGGKGYRVETFADLTRALEGLKTRDRPVLIDLKLDPDSMPMLV